MRAVSYGWRQENIAENAQAISNLGRELYGRMRLIAESFRIVGSKLDSAVHAYNKAAISLESRALVSARKLRELGAGLDKEIEPVTVIEKASRDFQSIELIPILLAIGETARVMDQSGVCAPIGERVSQACLSMCGWISKSPSSAAMT